MNEKLTPLSISNESSPNKFAIDFREIAYAAIDGGKLIIALKGQSTQIVFTHPTAVQSIWDEYSKWFRQEQARLQAELQN